MNEIAQHKIKIYEFPEVEEEEDTKLHKLLRDRVPFAVVGANTVIEHDGKKIRGRKYPWGIAEGMHGSLNRNGRAKFYTGQKLSFK